MLWKIYYTGEETFSSDNGEPWEAPRLGVLAIVSLEPDNGRQILARKDFYWWEGEWFGGDNFGLWDHLVRSSKQCALMGRFVPNAEYNAAIQRAINDTSFPPKSADNPGEVY